MSNSELREEANMTSIEETVTNKCWKYIGHILRRKTDDNRRVALQWAPEGKRKRERQKRHGEE